VSISDGTMFVGSLRDELMSNACLLRPIALTGRTIGEIAGKNLVPFTAELGGKVRQMEKDSVHFTYLRFMLNIPYHRHP
jgi:hypothetical protein